MKTYKITYGYTRTGRAKVAYYATEAAALKCAHDIFAATGIVVGVEVVAGHGERA